MKLIIDPRDGDVEDDASSTKRRSLFSLAGSLLAEISLPKLILSWTMLFVVPGLLLGLAPLVASAWIAMVSRKITSPLLGVWPALLLVTVLAIGLFGVRSLFRMAESSFWSLNSLAVEPIYVACREGLRHLVEVALQILVILPGDPEHAVDAVARRLRDVHEDALVGMADHAGEGGRDTGLKMRKSLEERKSSGARASPRIAMPGDSRGGQDSVQRDAGCRKRFHAAENFPPEPVTGLLP